MDALIDETERELVAVVPNREATFTDAMVEWRAWAEPTKRLKPATLRNSLDELSRRQWFTSPEDSVLCGPAGDPIQDSALRRRFNAARDAAGLPPLPFHHLRHTFARWPSAASIRRRFRSSWATTESTQDERLD